MRKGKKPERFLIILAVCLFLVYKRIPFSCDSSLGNGYIRSVSNALCTDNPNTQGDGEIGLAGNDTNAEGLQQRVPPGSRGKIKYTDNGDGSDSIRSSRESSEERGGQAVVADKSGQRDMRPEAIQGSDRSAHKAEGTWEVGGDGVIDRTDTISDIDDARDEAKELTQANSKETRTSDLNVYSGTCLHNAKERDPINSRVLVDKVAEASKECPILPFHIKQPGEGHDCVPFPDTYTYDVPLLDPHLFHYKNKRFEGVVGHGTVKAFVLSTAYCDLPVIVARQIQNVGSYWAGAKKSLIARGYRHYPQIVSFCRTNAGAGEDIRVADFAYVYEEGLIHIKDVSKTIGSMESLDSSHRWAAKLAVAIDYAHALAELHQEVAYPNFKNASMVYCDHKPSNVMVTSNLEVVLIDMDAMPTLSNIDDNGEPKAKKVDCSIKDPNDIMRLMGEGFDLREPIDDKLDSWYMGEYFKRFILTDPPPRFADEVKDIIKRLMGSYSKRISAGEAYCQLLQIREANADLTMKQRSQLKSQWLGQWEKTMRATFVKETNSHRALLSRLTPPGRKK